MVKRLAEIAAGLGGEAAFKEPSAAERARAAARLSGSGTAGPNRRVGALRRRRNKRLAAKLREPVLAPGQKPPPPPPKPRRRTASAARQPVPDRGYASPTQRGFLRRSLSPVVAVLAVVLIFTLAIQRWVFPTPSGSTTGAGSPGTHSSPSRTATPTPLVTPPFTAANPFAGSPAAGAGYADGAAGIVLPAAQPVGAFTKGEVAEAYKTVKNMLIASMLNWPTMQGDRPTALGRLLISQQRSWFYEHLTKPVRVRKVRPWRTWRWVTAFSPGTQVVGRIVRVHGKRMTAKAITVDNHPALQVYADYIFVYAVQQPGAPDSRLRIVGQQYATVQFAQWYDPGGPLEPWIRDFGASYAGAVCGEADGLVHPQFPSVGSGSIPPSGVPVDPYDLGRPKVHGACMATTGT
jgi:hypothetical protein